jgi:hypothetical protein
MIVRLGRSERRTEAYRYGTLRDLSDARTTSAVIFTVLP